MSSGCTCRHIRCLVPWPCDIAARISLCSITTAACHSHWGRCIIRLYAVRQVLQHQGFVGMLKLSSCVPIATGSHLLRAPEGRARGPPGAHPHAGARGQAPQPAPAGAGHCRWSLRRRSFCPEAGAGLQHVVVREGIEQALLCMPVLCTAVRAPAASAAAFEQAVRWQGEAGPPTR